MYTAKELFDYGTCSIVNCIYPANISATDKKYEAFEVWDSLTGEPLEAFTTRKQAKKFAHRFTADLEGTINRRRMLSGDRLTHCRALWALSLLSNWMECNIIITDKRNPHGEPEYLQASDMYVNRAGNTIAVTCYDSEDFYISGIKAVRAINDHTFAFETYQGKVYTVSGADW